MLFRFGFFILFQIASDVVFIGEIFSVTLARGQDSRIHEELLLLILLFFVFFQKSRNRSSSCIGINNDQMCKNVLLKCQIVILSDCANSFSYLC
jgi:hypothetical protein